MERPEDEKKQRQPSPGIYCFMDVVAREAEEYAKNHTSPMSPLLEEIERFSLTETPYPSMLTGRVEGRFLYLIVELLGARRIVDIGTFTGYSALAMAEASGVDAQVVTIERDPRFAKIARDFFDRSPAGAKITIRTGEALEILASLPEGETDLVFMDGDKSEYGAYYGQAMRILRTGGLVLSDNVLWYGKIFHPEDDDSRAVAEFNELVNEDPRAERLFLSIRDGLFLIRKRSV
ncbi:MAG: O-methyltransferase [Syntrophobacteraceae bacterium]